MQQLAEFVQDNIWLCLVIGVIVIIVGDEIFGITNGLFGDAADDYGFSRGKKIDLEKATREAQEEFPDENDKVSVDDLLGPGKRD